MKTNRHRTSWLAGLLGLAVLLFVNQTVQAQAVRGLANIAGKWGSGTPMIAAGGDHTCALTGDGLVRCWGSDFWGQLGNGEDAEIDPNNRFKTTPVLVPGVLTDAVAISAGGSHTCALRANGRIMCWGDNGEGQIGNGRSGIGAERLTPETVSIIDNAVSIAAGTSHSCAVLATGQVACWGANSVGQIGNRQIGGRVSTRVILGGITNAVMVAAGDGNTCALRATGDIMCWGANGVGQMGNGSISAPVPLPTAVSGITNATAITAGLFHTCALLATGSVMCWGDNSEGQIGSQTLAFSPQPIPVGITNAVAVTAGSFHTCALLATGNAQCWGSNLLGQLGNGNNSPQQPIPVSVSLLGNAVAIAAGGAHTCAFIAPARMRCWGRNLSGQLGNNSRIASNLPVTTALTRSISAGEVASGDGHSCALRVDGTVSCWGSNSVGQLGNGTETHTPQGPVAVSGLNTALSVELGARHSCALQTDGRVACWGSNASGQLGVGLTFPATLKTNRPVTVQADRLGQPLTGVKQLAVGSEHVCVLMTRGDVRCWGNNASGQLGDGTRTNQLWPVRVAGIEDAVELRLGEFHSCARLASGVIRCWGKNNEGQLGDGSTDERLTPVTVAGLSDAIALAAGGEHTCALRAGGVAQCWGANKSGQLGDGTYFRSTIPETVTSLAGVTALSVGSFHTCAVLVDGAAFCWGSNFRYMLGGGLETLDSSLPVRVREATRDLGSVVGISARDTHACALSASGMTKGAPVCWGSNGLGELGSGRGFDKNFAVEVPSFRFNIDPAVVLRSSPRSASVTALIDCPAKEVVRIQATLRQDGVEGTATGTKACKGYLHRYPLKVTARNKGRFIEGTGVVEASGIVKKRGQVTDTQNWTRNVQVSSTVAVP